MANYFNGYPGVSPDFWTHGPIILFIIGIFGYILAVSLIVFFRAHRKLFLNKALYVAVSFLSMFALIYPLARFASPVFDDAGNVVATDAIAALALTAKTAAGSFAFQWPEEITAYISGVDMLLLVVPSALNFFFLSYAIVESVLHGAGGYFRNRWFFLFPKKAHYYLFTDLPYADIKDFLTSLKKKKNTAITMVFNREDMFCEDPTFLRDQINALNIHTQVAIINNDYFKALFHRLRKRKSLYVYSFYNDDKDNLKLAEYIRNGLTQHVVRQKQHRKIVNDAIEASSKYSVKGEEKYKDSDKNVYHNDPDINKVKDIVKEAMGKREEKGFFLIRPYVKRRIKEEIEEGRIKEADGSREASIMGAYRCALAIIKAERMLNAFLDRFNCIDAFISYQDSAIVDSFDEKKSCCGHVHYYSEYENVAEKFVLNHPITDFIHKDALREYQRIADHDGVAPTPLEDKKKPLDFDDILHLVGPVHFDFIGFGNVNQAMFREMASAYQLPGNKAYYLGSEVDPLTNKRKPVYAVSYKAYCLDGQGEGVSKIMAIPGINDDGLGLVHIDDVQLDIRSKEGQDTLIENLHLKDGEIHNIIISLGDSEQNMQTAFEIRSLIYQKMVEADLKNKVEALQLGGQHRDPKYNPLNSRIRIYVYVKESGLYSDLCFNSEKEEHGKLDSFFRKRRKSRRRIRESLYYSLHGVKKPSIEYKDDSKKLYIFNAFSEENCLFSEGKMKLEKGVIPILVFGRNGRFWNQQDQALLHMASGCKDSYYSMLTLDSATLEIRPDYNIPSSPRELKNLYFEFSDSTPSEQDDNYDAALGLKPKLALLGYRLADNGAIKGVKPIVLNSSSLIAAFKPRVGPEYKLCDLEPKYQDKDKVESAAETREREEYRAAQKELFKAIFIHSRTKTANMVATMEHNRWTIRQVISGKVSIRDAMPYLNSNLKGKKGAERKIKLPENVIGHGCICDNDSLTLLEEELYDIRVRSCEKDDSPDRCLSFQNGVFEDYSLCYWNDVGSLLYIINLLPNIGEEKPLLGKRKEEGESKKGPDSRIEQTFRLYSYADVLEARKREE
ncbi:MAG: hypothetical protein K6B65_04455 [Bacilli bacterium]|nr:hypothetical protein [Bacilli bacterium]